MEDQSLRAERALALIVQFAWGGADAGTSVAGLRLRTDLGLDSLGIWGLLLRFGEVLGIDPDDLVATAGDDPLDTVGHLAATARRCQAARCG